MVYYYIIFIIKLLLLLLLLLFNTPFGLYVLFSQFRPRETVFLGTALSHGLKWENKSTQTENVYLWEEYFVTSQRDYNGPFPSGPKCLFQSETHGFF